jgi:hypothetical protein
VIRDSLGEVQIDSELSQRVDHQDDLPVDETAEQCSALGAIDSLSISRLGSVLDAN